jgi:hypothetical protein
MTGAEFIEITNKTLLGREAFTTYGLAYTRTLIQEMYQRVYGTALKGGTFGAGVKVVISADGVDHFQLTDQNGYDGAGHFMRTGSTSQEATEIQFQNTNAIPYHIAFKYQERPKGLVINPRTGMPNFKTNLETFGEKAAPTSLVDNLDGTLTFNINSVCEAGVSHAGRRAYVWKVVPGKEAISENLAIEPVDVVWDGANNKITTVHNFGQGGTPSVTAADYMVLLVGPTVRRNTDLSTLANYWYIGTVTGAGAGNAPVTFNNGAQFSIDSFVDSGDLANISRIDAHGFRKIRVQADGTDAAEPQIDVIAFGGGTRFEVTEAGNMRVYRNSTFNDRSTTNGKIIVGSLDASPDVPSIWIGLTSPSATNFFLRTNSTYDEVYLNSSVALEARIGNAAKIRIIATEIQIKDDLIPDTSITLGDTTHRWSKLWAIDVDLSGNVVSTGAIGAVTLAASSTAVNGFAASTNHFVRKSNVIKGWGRIDAAGAILYSYNVVAAARTALGIYNISLQEKAGNNANMSLYGNAFNSGIGRFLEEVTPAGGADFTVHLRDHTGALQDNIFNFLILAIGV